MPTPSSTSGLRDNHSRGTVGSFLHDKIQDASRLSIVSAYFTIYAYDALKSTLDRIEHLDFLFGEPSSVNSLDPNKRDMKSFIILGLDAAWAPANCSGIALAKVHGKDAELLMASPSVASFLVASAGHPLRWHSQPEIPLVVEDLLEGTLRLTGREPDVVAVDMPLSHSVINGRRVADQLVSQKYGARGAPTHSPTDERPGSYGRELQRQFMRAGYKLQTEARVPRALIEVYPHPAIIELCGADRRLPYKWRKRSCYWPALAPLKRKQRIVRVWEKIVEALEREMRGTRLRFPEPKRLAQGFKCFEDALDAALCAWVAICYLRRRTCAYGDDCAAIWIPYEDWKSR